MADGTTTQDQTFDPVAELRQRYPGVASEPDDKIREHLSDPNNFRSAFPEYSHLDDDTIKRNMSAPMTATEESLPGSTPRLRAAVNSGVTKMQPPTSLEQNTPKMPAGGGFSDPEHPEWQEFLGLPSKHVLGAIGEGAKGLITSGAGAAYDALLGEPNKETGKMEHGIGGLVGMNAQGEFAPGERAGALAKKYIADPASEEWEKAKAEQAQGHTLGAVGHAGAAALPLVGPWAAHLGERAGTGDIGGATGEALGTVAAGGIANELPNVSRIADKVVRGTPFTDAGRLDAAVKQITTVKPPTMNEVEYEGRVRQAVGDLQDIATKNGGKIESPIDARNAINERIGQLEHPIGTQLEALRNDPRFQVHPDEYQGAISSAIDQALGKLDTLNPEEKAAAKAKVMDWFGERPKSYAELEGNRQRMNQEADKYWKADTAGKRAIDVSDATATAQRAAGNALRDMLYGDDANPGMLEKAGIKITDSDGNPVNMRDFRKRVGNLIEIRDHFEDAIVKAQRSGDWSAFGAMSKGPSLAAGGLGALWGMMSGHLGLGIVGGEALKSLADYRNTKNANLNTEKAFRNLASTAPQEPAPQLNVTATQPPPLRDQRALPAPATAAGWNEPDTSGPVRGGRWTTPAAQLSGVGAIHAQFVREIPHAPAEVPNRPLLPAPQPEVPLPATNIPPLVTPQHAVEPTGTMENPSLVGIRGQGGIRTAAPRFRGEIPEKPSSLGAIGGPEPRQGELGAIGQKEEPTPAQKKSPEEAPKTVGKIGEHEPIDYTRPMPIPRSRTAVVQGTTEAVIHHHELGHAIVGALDGFEQNGIVSHRYAMASGPGIGAATMFRVRQFRDANGNFDMQLLGDKADKLADLFAAGAAANELVDRIPRDQNVGLYGDKRMAHNLFKALGFPEEKFGELFNAAVDRAKEKLSAPGIADIIKDEATRREDNLPVEYHYSKNRVEHIVNRVKGLQNEPIESTGNAAGNLEGSNRGGEEAVAGREGQSAPSARTEAAPQRLKPFSPPKNTYVFDVEAAGKPTETITLDALNRRKAWEALGQKAGPYYKAEMKSETAPEVGPPHELEPTPHQVIGLKDIPDKLVKELEPDEMEYLRAHPLLQKNVAKEYAKIEPTLKEAQETIKAGHVLGGWWQRFIDAFDAMGETKAESDIKQLGPAHSEALKAVHSALSGNKSVEHANKLAWGAYHDWLEAGRPRDRAAINDIIAQNGKPRGVAAISDTIKNGKTVNEGLDTTKFWKLVNSPQFRDVSPEPFHGNAFVGSPAEGVSPGAKKIPSMLATTANKGNLNRVVFDTHMKDLYGQNGLTDAKYIADSIHIRQAAKQLGLKAGEGQEQMWGTVLGLKQLMKEGLAPGKAARALNGGIIGAIGKDYAQVMLEAMQNDPEFKQILTDLKKYGFDPGGPVATEKLERIVESGKSRQQQAQPPVNKALLANSARRIASQMKNFPGE
jgi:hypothetical protein